MAERTEKTARYSASAQTWAGVAWACEREGAYALGAAIRVWLRRQKGQDRVAITFWLEDTPQVARIACDAGLGRDIYPEREFLAPPFGPSPYTPRK